METRYTILVKGRLDPRWAVEFEPLEVIPREDGTTALTGGLTDVCSLFAHLRRVEQCGLSLVSVTPEGEG